MDQEWAEIKLFFIVESAYDQLCHQYQRRNQSANKTPDRVSNPITHGTHEDLQEFFSRWKELMMRQDAFHRLEYHQQQELFKLLDAQMQKVVMDSVMNEAHEMAMAVIKDETVLEGENFELIEQYFQLVNRSVRENPRFPYLNLVSQVKVETYIEIPKSLDIYLYRREARKTAKAKALEEYKLIQSEVERILSEPFLTDPVRPWWKFW
ncbi:MAG: hypothetical protein K2X66_14920 [Cyanobacteria bacterium]|nr:hypothetical protein [Cyanobacteriota bacterium]